MSLSRCPRFIPSMNRQTRPAYPTLPNIMTATFTIPTMPETVCISFVVMQDRNLAQAFTTDHHFEQAGFRILMER
jgi:hypothetical protein